MSAPLSIKHVCADCNAHFVLSYHEMHSQTRARCPGCGSLFVDRRQDRMATINSSIREMAGRTTLYSETHDAQTHSLGVLKNKRGRWGRDSAAAKRARLMSEPGNYRLAALKGTHQRMLAARGKAAHQAKLKELLDPDIDYSTPKKKPGQKPRPKEPRIKVKDLTTGHARHYHSKLRDGP